MSTLQTNNRKRKRSNAHNSNHHTSKKQRQTRQTYLDTDSIVSSLQFHPSTHTFAASSYDGNIDLYRIDQLKSKTTKLTHSFHHPCHSLPEEESLKQLIQSNQQKLERLKQLQTKNTALNLDEFDDSDSDSENESHTLSSISITDTDTKNTQHSFKSIPCKQTRFNSDGTVLFGAWNDCTIAMFDTKKHSLIHHFTARAQSDTDTDTQSQLTAMQLYSDTLILTGDADGVIQCWDTRMNASKAKSQKQFLYTSHMKHTLSVHEDGINCFESIPAKHRVIAGSSDGQISVWDLRKSSDLTAIKSEMDRKRKRTLLRKRARMTKRQRNEHEMREKLFGLDNTDMDSENIKPKTLKAVSDKMGDEILSLCLVKYGQKLLCGMTSGALNVFTFGDWEWYGDRVNGHSANLSCLVKYDEDCVITGSDDGVVRLISLYPHKFIHSIGTHDLNSIDCVAMSCDKRFVVSYACGNKRAQTWYDTQSAVYERQSAREKYEWAQTQKEILKIWDLSWHPLLLYNERQGRAKSGYNKKRHRNQCKLPRGVKEFLELSDSDFEFDKFDNEKLDKFKEGTKGTVKTEEKYVFSDDESEEGSGMESEQEMEIETAEKSVELDLDLDGQRRIRYKTFQNREEWMKHLGSRKKIRAIGKHDVKKYHCKKFFRDLCNY